MARPNQLPRHDDPTEIEPRPHPVAQGTPRPNVTHLKQDITSGTTGDKVAVFDPGAADLGTDNEAAGAPSTPEMVRMDRAAQGMADPPHGDPGRRAGLGRGGALAGAIAALVTIGLLAVALG